VENNENKNITFVINLREYPRDNKKLENPEKLATFGTQNVEK